MKLKGNQGILAVMLVVAACTATAARGDLVFTLASASASVPAGELVEVDAVLDFDGQIQMVKMDVFFNATAGSLGFDYDSGFGGKTTSGIPLTPVVLDQRVNGIGGFFGAIGDPLGGPTTLPIGKFVIDTTGMAANTYSLQLDSSGPVDDPRSFFTIPVGDNAPHIPLSGTSFTFTVTSSVVPVPGAFLLGAVGLGFVGWFRRRTA